MDERCYCPTCGRPHRKKKVVDYIARAKKAAGARWKQGVWTGPSAGVPDILRPLTKEERAELAAAEPLPSTTVAVAKVKKHGCVQHRVHQEGCQYCEL